MRPIAARTAAPTLDVAEPVGVGQQQEAVRRSPRRPSASPPARSGCRQRRRGNRPGRCRGGMRRRGRTGPADNPRRPASRIACGGRQPQHHPHRSRRRATARRATTRRGAAAARARRPSPPRDRRKAAGRAGSCSLTSSGTTYAPTRPSAATSGPWRSDCRDRRAGGRGEQREGEPGGQEAVERMRRVEAGEDGRRAGGGERLRHVGRGSRVAASVASSRRRTHSAPADSADAEQDAREPPAPSGVSRP